MDNLVLTPVVWPNRLRELREAKGRARGRKLLIEEVAGAVDCSVGYLSRIEKGKGKPSEELLKTLAQYYKVKVDQLAAGDAPRPQIGEANILGAYVRRQRKALGLSIQAMAERVSQRLMSPLSESSMRNIEAGHRAFLPEDEITMALVTQLGLSSLEDLRARASEAAEEGKLEDILLGFQGGSIELVGDTLLYADARGGELGVPGPAFLARYVSPRDGDYAVRLDRPVLGSALPVGTFLVARRNSRPSDGGLAVVWDGDLPKAVRLFLDHEKGLVGLRDGPREELVVEGGRLRVDRVVAAVLP